MIKRSFYTVKQMLKYNDSLKKLKNGYQLDSIVNLTPELLKQNNIDYLALDFDGVLASHGKPKMHNDVESWLNDFVTKFAEDRIFILSNKPTQERLEYFKKLYPQIRFMSGVAKKPYPDGLNEIIKLVGCSPNQLALVDDRLLTGCLACIISGSYPILITKPFVDLQNYTKEERFFKFLRITEQKMFL